MNEQDNEDGEIFEDDESSSSEDEESMVEKGLEDALGWKLVEGDDSSAGQKDLK